MIFDMLNKFHIYNIVIFIGVWVSEKKTNTQHFNIMFYALIRNVCVYNSCVDDDGAQTGN